MRVLIVRRWGCPAVRMSRAIRGGLGCPGCPGWFVVRGRTAGAMGLGDGWAVGGFDGGLAGAFASLGAVLRVNGSLGGRVAVLLLGLAAHYRGS